MQRPVTRTAPVKSSTADASNGIPLSEFVKGADPNKPGQSVMYRLFDVFFQQYSDLLDILSFEKNDVCRSEILAFMHFSTAASQKDTASATLYPHALT